MKHPATVESKICLRRNSFRVLATGFVVLLLCLFFPLAAQDPPTEQEDVEEEEFEDTLWNTSRVTKYLNFGASVGFASLVGELNNDINVSAAEKLGAQVYFNYGITPSFTLGVALSTARVYGQIRSDGSDQLFTNLNVKTTLISPQIRAIYNFGGLYRNQMPGHIQPWVFAGVEPLFFNPYADLTAADGTPYHYWSDGSIRNMPELPENIGKADFLVRDYFYESPLRDADLDGLGSFPAVTLSFPIGIGLDFNLNETFSLSLSASYHITFTDHLDDITHLSGALDPTRAIGNTRKDGVMLFNAGITFKYYETEPIETRSLNIRPPGEALLPVDFVPFDLNSDNTIQRDEVLLAIEQLFSGDSEVDPEIISLLVDFYNVQEYTREKITF